jgi:hypothetical protein
VKERKWCCFVSCIGQRFKQLAFFALIAAQATEIFELSQDAWTWDRTANEREMKLSLDMSRQSLKKVRQEPTPADMYDFAHIPKAKQDLETKGWAP